MHSFFCKKTIVLYGCFFLLMLLIAPSATAEVKRLRCMWRDDPATTMVIGWDQVKGNNPLLYYDTYDHGTDASGYLFQQTPARHSDFKGMNNYFARLSDLTPNTIYYFVIKDSEGVSRRFSFKTMPDTQNTRLAIVAGGDSRNHREARRNANMIVSKLRPHFVLFGGDMTARDVDSEWVDWLDDWQVTITQEGRLIPIVVARGNHEYSNKTLVELFDVRHTDLYYKMSFADDLLEVYTLNSLIATGGDQKNWLEHGLSSSDARWKMAQYHFTIRPHTQKKAERNEQYVNWATLFYKYELDLVVESDAHVVKSTYPIRPSTEAGSEEGFVRDDENGTVYVGEGCWGAPLRRNDDNKSWTRNSGSFNQFKWIFVDKSGIEVRTIKVDNAAQVGALQGDHLFTAPPNLDIWNPSNGDVIRIKSKTTAPQVVHATPEKVSPEKVAPVKKPFEPSDKTKSRPAKIVTKGEHKITDFVAIEKTSGVYVTWKVENERLGIRYEIQRSWDGEKYETIKTVEGKETDEPVTTHQIQDGIARADFREGVSYRIRRVLPNSEARNFAPCLIGGDLQNWQTYPLLQTDISDKVRLQYQLSKPAKVAIRLLTKTLREIRYTPLDRQGVGSYVNPFSLRGLPDGEYIIIVQADRHFVGRYRVRKE